MTTPHTQASRRTAAETAFSSSSISFEAKEAEVSFTGVGITLHGTFTYPVLTQHFAKIPAVLLIPGSGPTDRDGNQQGLKTDLLKQLATALAHSGVASLRFDKRSVASYSSIWPKDLPGLSDFFSWNNFVQDAQNAFEYLQKSEGVDANRCSILGHSEGGVIASTIAPVLNPAHLILMATPGRPLEAVLQTQIEDLLSKQNATPEQKSYFLSENQRVIRSIKLTGVVPSDVPSALKALYPPSVGKFLQALLPLSPEDAFSSYSGPVLVLNGKQDIQVSPSMDAQALFASLQIRTGSKQEIDLITGLSHNFKPVFGLDDQGFSGSVPNSVTDLILKWIEN